MHKHFICNIHIFKPFLFSFPVNRLCGSGFQSIVSGVQDILVGDSEVVLTGGTDNMSACPYAVRDIRFVKVFFSFKVVFVVQVLLMQYTGCFFK